MPLQRFVSIVEQLIQAYGNIALFAQVVVIVKNLKIDYHLYKASNKG